MNGYAEMDKYLGTTMTIEEVASYTTVNPYKMKEDEGNWNWSDAMIEGKLPEVNSNLVYELASLTLEELREKNAKLMDEALYVTSVLKEREELIKSGVFTKMVDDLNYVKGISVQTAGRIRQYGVITHTVQIIHEGKVLVRLKHKDDIGFSINLKGTMYDGHAPKQLVHVVATIIGKHLDIDLHQQMECKLYRIEKRY